MAYIVLDTNVIVMMLRNQAFKEDLYEKYSFTEHDLIISVVTEGELWSLALQWEWGNKRIHFLAQLLQTFIVYPIRVQAIIQRYAQIDAYSQDKWKEKKLNTTPRNMGKNDIWIAATASVLDATLITLDKDFTHLENDFLTLELISII